MDLQLRSSALVAGFRLAAAPVTVFRRLMFPVARATPTFLGSDTNGYGRSSGLPEFV